MCRSNPSKTDSINPRTCRLNSLLNSHEHQIQNPPWTKNQITFLHVTILERECVSLNCKNQFVSRNNPPVPPLPLRDHIICMTTKGHFCHLEKQSFMLLFFVFWIWVFFLDTSSSTGPSDSHSLILETKCCVLRRIYGVLISFNLVRHYIMFWTQHM